VEEQENNPAYLLQGGRLQGTQREIGGNAKAQSPVPEKKKNLKMNTS
jgi:hypothetical protein